MGGDRYNNSSVKKVVVHYSKLEPFQHLKEHRVFIFSNLGLAVALAKLIYSHNLDFLLLARDKKSKLYILAIKDGWQVERIEKMSGKRSYYEVVFRRVFKR